MKQGWTRERGTPPNVQTWTCGSYDEEVVAADPNLPASHDLRHAKEQLIGQQYPGRQRGQPTIGPSDFVGQQTYVLADGSEVPSDIFIIRSLKIGDRLVKNVNASIASPKATLLLGQSFLGQFKSWSIDNAKHALILE